jgi:hypothetical protein
MDNTKNYQSVAEKNEKNGLKQDICAKDIKSINMGNFEPKNHGKNQNKRNEQDPIDGDGGGGDSNWI